MSTSSTGRPSTLTRCAASSASKVRPEGFVSVAVQQRGRDRAPSHLRIVAIESRQDTAGGEEESSADEAAASSEDSGEILRSTPRGIIVPIDGIATIPKVLQIGTRVAFVVPAYP